MAIRTYFTSPAHDDPWIESALDIKDRQGNSLPGYGWIFPVGDGTINAGIGLLSTFKNYKEVNTSWLMEEWAHALPDFWQIDPTTPQIPAVGGKLPMGGSITPKAGPNWLVAGDAAGTINPFNGEGIDYAYETGRAAANLTLDFLAGSLTQDQLPHPIPNLAGRHLRPLLQGRPPVRQSHRPTPIHQPPHPDRHAIAHLDGMGPAHHGQPAAPQPPRPRRTRLRRHAANRPAAPAHPDLSHPIPYPGTTYGSDVQRNRCWILRDLANC